MPGDTYTILVAEDELNTQQLYREELTEAGYEVIVVGNGLEVMFNLETEKVDLLITDSSMPLMDAFDMIAQVRRKYPELPIVAITGHHNEEEYLSRGLKLRAYFHKPVQMSEVKKTILRIRQGSQS